MLGADTVAAGATGAAGAAAAAGVVAAAAAAAVVTDAADAADAAKGAKGANADADAGGRRHRRRRGVGAYCPGLLFDWRALCAQYLLLLEATFGWVTGCAWTDALVAYTPLGENTIEKPWVAAEDLLVACAFTALGVLWLVSTGEVMGVQLGEGGAAWSRGCSVVMGCSVVNGVQLGGGGRRCERGVAW